MNHQRMKLDEICDFLYGEGLPEVQRKNGSIPVYGSNGIVGWHNQAVTKGTTIIIGRKGSIGEVHFSKVPCWPIDTTYYVKAPKRPCDLRWLYYTLIALDLTQLNKSAAVPGLNRDDAYEKEIPYYSLPEQKRIAGILEKADRLRQQRRYALELSNTYLQTVFLEMFGDPVTNPKGWSRVPISELGTVQTGNTPSRDVPKNYGDYIEWIKSDNIVEGLLYITKSRERLSALGARQGRVIEPMSLLITCIAGSSTTIGNVALTNRRVAFNQQINAITPNNEINPFFLYGMFLVAKPLIQRSTTLGMKRIITKSKLENLYLVMPPKELQEKFATIAQRIERIRTQQREAEHQAEHLFQTLLHQAFQGELELEDGPAAMTGEQGRYTNTPDQPYTLPAPAQLVAEDAAQLALPMD